ncbi:MAG: ATP-dependent DNA helicase RecG [Mycobacteriales bacterium]|nr:ATP-dependent DNA helicase RecG [Mycobacteriales bacterium]
MVALGAPVHHAVGKSAKAFEQLLGLRTVGDLLRHYPRRYAERGKLMPFSELVVGEHATVMAEVVHVAGRLLRPKLHKTDVTIRDDGGATMKLAIFNRPWVAGTLTPGRRALFSGKVEVFNRAVQLANPEFALVDDDDGTVVSEFAGALLPIYPATAKLDSVAIARSVRMALDIADLDDDPLPASLLADKALPSLREALHLVHRPESWADVSLARQRLKWDEAFVLQVVLAQRRAALVAMPGVPRPGRAGGIHDALLAQLPFTLTGGQREIGEVLAAELADDHPMHRLLQGEVGTGKTLVALLAMLRVVDSGGQAALLAPTEVLAQQHHRSMRAMLGALGQAGELGGADVATRVALLTGSQGAAARRDALDEVASGAAGIVVGTHALLSEGVAFADLGLVVVDEQHRFGVEQRDALRAKGEAPHVLVMTATPIPRTVAMTVYGDLEVSTLTEMPAGRSPVRTAVVPVAEQPAWLERAWERVREAVSDGRQAFVVCPRIGGDDEGPAEDGRRPAVAVEELLPVLTDGPLRGLRVAGLHGRMGNDAKDDVMGRFVLGEVEVLVATTVVEVGVDVPNSSVMVVMDADRFGVSQLHQLRGRIGRGEHGGLCLLVTEAPLGSPARERLDAVAATSDGFALSRIDLEQRREGDVLGAAQSGSRSSLKMLQLLRDEDVIREAREAAAALVAKDPALERHAALRDAVRELVDDQRADFLEKA